MFATRLGQAPDGSEPDHIRLKELNDKLQKDSEVWNALVEPTQSYFSGIVRGGLGRMGRPLIFLCEGKCDLAERTVVMHRPDFADYHTESRNIRLWRSDSKRAEIVWALRDGFALFESRHLVYLLSLVSIDEQIDRIDEYALIQLHKLLDPSFEATALRSELRFSFSPRDPTRWPLATLIEKHQELARPTSLVEARLHELDSQQGQEANGVHVLKKHVLEQVDWKLPSFGWTELRSLVFAIEDDEIWNDFATKEKWLQSDSQDQKDWQEEESSVSDGYPPHLNSKCVCPRLYSLSGFFRGVLDFPLQDTSELEDALEPVCPAKEDWAAFYNRGCLVEIGTSKWRSLRDGRSSIGTCPYAALVQCMILYHEALLTDLEKEIDDLLYRAQDARNSKTKIHAEAMRDLSTMLDYARKLFRFFSPSSGMVAERKLRQRIAIVRDLLIFRPINIFNYKMEHDLFDALVAHNEIEARTAAIIDLLDRYEGLVEDSHHVLTMEAERRLSLLFALVALMGVLAIYEPVEALFGRENYHFLKDYNFDLDRLFIVGVAVALLGLLLYFLWSRKR